MNVRRVVGEAGDALGAGVSRLGIGLPVRLAVVGGMALAVAASIGAGGAPVWVVPALFVAGALVVAARPDSHAGLAVMFAVGWYWLAHVDRTTSPWALVAAAGLLLFHLATAAAALGPAELSLPPTLVREWTRRAGLVMAATAGVWLLGAGFERLDAAANLVLTSLALVAVAGGGWLALVRSRPRRP